MTYALGIVSCAPRRIRGGCLPKTFALCRRAEELGVQEAVSFLKEVDSINQRRRDRVVSEVLRSLSGNVDGAHVTVLGAAFKPNSDDIRDSPALEVAQRLHDLGAVVDGDRPERPWTAVAKVRPDLPTEDRPDPRAHRRRCGGASH